MPDNDAADRSQSNAGSREFFHCMQSLKGREKFVDVGHVKPHPVIAHKKYPRTVRTQDLSNTYRGICLLRGELPGVAQQIFQHDFDEPAVALGLQASIYLQSDLTLRMVSFPFLQHAARQRRQVYCFAAKLGASHMGQ